MKKSMYIFSQDCGDQQWWYWDNTPFRIRNCFYEEKTDMTLKKNQCMDTMNGEEVARRYA